MRALDVAKRLLEEGFHAPTVYFPLDRRGGAHDRADRDREPGNVAALAEALRAIADEARRQTAGGEQPAHEAPRSTPVGRLDEARAARRLVTTFDAREETAD